MKSVANYLSILLLLSGMTFLAEGIAFAQSASSYSVSRSTGISYNSISSTGNSFASWLDYSSTDDNRSAPTDIGFTFSYMGSSYTQFSISTNGYMDFSSSTADGETAEAYGFENSQFSSPSGTLLAIAPLYDDLIGKTSLANGFKYLVTGSAPNRVLTVEWISFRLYSDPGSDLNFQVRLYETTNKIEIIYGSVSGNSGTYTVGINNSTMSSTPLPSELLTQQTPNTGTFSNSPQNSLSTLPESNSMITFVIPNQAKYYGGSFDGYDGKNSIPSNANGVSPNLAKFYGGSYDGYALSGTPLSNLGGSTMTALKYHGGSYDGYGVVATLLANLNGATLTLSKYYGGSYDGYSVLAASLGNLNGVTATLSKYQGGSYDGYAAFMTLLTNLSGSTTAVSKYYGGSFDGYADILSPRTSLGNGIVADAKFYGGSYDGFAGALSFPLPMQITGAKYLGGSFDGFMSLQTLITNFNGLTLLLAKYFGGSFDGYDALTSSESGALAIQLAAFTARPNPAGKGILLEWSTISEENNYGFYVERSKENDSAFADVPNSFVAGHGTTLQKEQYSFVDSTVTGLGKYYYCLRQVDLDGTTRTTAPVMIDVSVLSVIERAPIEFRVYQNYPNPFNPTTIICFTVDKTEWAKAAVYNILGQEVERLFDGIAEPGRYYRFDFPPSTGNGSQLSSGVYLYRVATSNHVVAKKMLLLR
ncbi:MAG: T9SS type A sorting domain-containing protein [Bacteroidota bacterium]|jgi:hypothetical protein